MEDKNVSSTGRPKAAAASMAAVKFTPSQQTAIDVTSGFHCIIAGAGTGKTKTMVGRVVRLLKDGTRPEKILVITFSRDAAKEFRDRVSYLMGGAVPGLHVDTFHAFFYRIVMDNYEELGFQKPPKVIQGPQKSRIIDGLLKANPIPEWMGQSFRVYQSTGRFGPKGALAIARDVFSAIKKLKEHLGTVTANDIPPEVTQHQLMGSGLKKLVDLYPKYQKILKDEGWIDFDDMPILAQEFLKSHPDYLPAHDDFEEIIVDELQDTTAEQFELLKSLTDCPSFKCLVGVGDPRQSIYQFRGTSPEYIENFSKYIGHEADVIVLRENWRSRKPILDFADSYIALNDQRTDEEKKEDGDPVDSRLIAMRGDGPAVTAAGFYTPKDELAFMVRVVKTRIADGMEPERICIEGRTKEEVRSIVDALTEAGIPSMYAAPEPYLGNDRVRAAIAFTHVILDGTDKWNALVAANAVMDGGIMDISEEEMNAKTDEVMKKASDIRLCADPAQQKELFFQFLDSVTHGDEAVESFRESLEYMDYEDMLAYMIDLEVYDAENLEMTFTRTGSYAGRVYVTTDHSAKGREWDVVIMSVTKFMRATEKPSVKSRMEARRLLYVGATRAREQLYITGQYGTGTIQNRIMNPYLFEVYRTLGMDWSPDYEAYSALRAAARRKAKTGTRKKGTGKSRKTGVA